jgi:hypothetical protein
LQGDDEVVPAFGQAVADLDGRTRHDRAGDQTLGLELLQPLGEQAVRQPVDASQDVAEPLGAEGERAQDRCAPAAADDPDGGLEASARLVDDHRRGRGDV